MGNLGRTSCIVAALALAACAGSSASKTGGLVGTVKQADDRPPQGAADVVDEGERQKLRDAQTHQQRGATLESGNAVQAQQEFRAAAQGFQQLGAAYESSEWRIVYHRLASENFRRANDLEDAAKEAEAIRTTAGASAASHALGSRLAAGLWQAFGNAEAKAGRVEPMRIVSAAQRKGQKPSPRPLGAPWRRFVENADLYAQSYKADPDPKAADHAAALSYLAAVAHFSHDDVEEARKRLDAMLRRFPAAEQAGDAVALYLQTYAVAGDHEGYRDALQRVAAEVDQLVNEATQKAAAPNAPPEAKERADRLAQLKQQIAADQKAQGFTEASGLLSAGKPAEAAAAFERFVAEDPDSADAPTALYNAAVAYDRAEQPGKAVAARERLLAEYGDSKLAGPATLALAAARSRANDHAGAADLYGQFLAKWPEGENRCLALQNRGAASFAAGKKESAAKQLADFGKDAACANADPNAAARSLYTAGAAFFELKRKDQARDAWGALVKVPGVTDTVAKSQVEDARQRLKVMR